MPAEFMSFGTPDRFEIGIRTRLQRDPMERWPKGYGWSLGDLRITVGRRVLTENLRGAVRRSYVSWYLLPLFEWIAQNWTVLLHEEDFGWPEPSPLPAAVVVPSILAATVEANDEQGSARYHDAQQWRERHALRASATGGLFPDVYFRRFLDSIEISWTDTQPKFAPDDFRLITPAGYAGFSVEQVATPIWDALNFVADGGLGKPRLEADRERLALLSQSVERLRGLTVVEMAAARISKAVLEKLLELPKNLQPNLLSGDLVDDAPAIAAFSPATAMYGGLSPDLGLDDVQALSSLAVAAAARSETSHLLKLVRNAGGIPRRPAFAEGYELANQLLEELNPQLAQGWVDIRALLDALSITVVEQALSSESVRGVALAGRGVGPTILINISSPFNRDEEGKRFTLAHELCHILYDRGRALRVGISSGPWAPAAVERRSNAFAAMLLMPRDLVISTFAELDADYRAADDVSRVAMQLHVSWRALMEHLYNLRLIGDADRESLRRSMSN